MIELSQENRKKFFYNLLRIRMVEERIAELYASEQEMRCPTHLSIGQEAIAAGICTQLRKTDYVMSAHRSHAHYLAKGGSLKAMISEMYGKATGCASGKGGSMHLIDPSVGFLGAVPIVGSTISISLGAALSTKMKGEDRVVVAFFGDGATETGVFHESLNFAELHKLPIVLICENNFYSVLSPLSVRQPENREIYELAQAHGVKSYHGDGNILEEVYSIGKEAIDHARSGKGPVFLEFKTYRWLEHCGPLGDEHLGYRTTDEVDAWKLKDPVALSEKSLINQSVMTAQEVREFKEKIAEEIEEAVQFAKASPFPNRKELSTYLYADDNFFETRKEEITNGKTPYIRASA